MRLFRRRREPLTFPGIRFRISTINGVIVDADSAQLYYSAKYASFDPCDPGCLPGCDRHGWLNLIAGGEHGAREFSRVPLKIQVKPVRLPAGQVRRCEECEGIAGGCAECDFTGHA